MRMTRMCSDDPLIAALRETLGANPLRIPDVRVTPLTVLASKKARSVFRGRLTDILRAPPPALINFKPIVGSIAQVKDRSSLKIQANIGIKILEGLCSGLGFHIPNTKAAYRGVHEFQFHFRGAKRHYAEPNWLGKALRTVSVDLTNPAAAIFEGPNKFDCLVVDSTIVSKSFSITCFDRSGGDAAVNIATLHDRIGSATAKASVSQSAKGAITFRGPHYLAFAFTCCRIALAEDGAIVGLPPEEGSLRYERRLIGSPRQDYAFPHVLLSDQPGLISLDD